METVLSMLLAPCVMAAHTFMVASIVLGRAVGWGTQNRDADGTSWGEAITVHLTPTLLGLGWAALAWYISPVFAAWMSPILLGLILSIPVSVWTSRARWGKALANHKILSTPEELDPPAVMKLADVAKASVDPALDATVPGRHGVIAAVVDPYVNGVHVSLLEPSELSAGQEAVVERCLLEGPAGLSKDELIDLFYHAPGMLMLHRAVWLRPAEGIHTVWTQAVESYRRRIDAGGEPE
jgi:membrane glycosyltransferase